MMENMKNGSVIIDLAAATGGNTELTKNDETVKYKGVSIVGNSALASQLCHLMQVKCMERIF